MTESLGQRQQTQSQDNLPVSTSKLELFAGRYTIQAHVCFSGVSNSFAYDINVFYADSLVTATGSDDLIPGNWGDAVKTIMPEMTKMREKYLALESQE